MSSESAKRGVRAWVWALAPVVILAAAGLVAGGLLPPVSVARCRLEVRRTKPATPAEEIARTLHVRLMSDDVLRGAYERASELEPPNTELERAVVKLRGSVRVEPVDLDSADVTFTFDGSPFQQTLFRQLIAGVQGRMAEPESPDLRHRLEQTVRESEDAFGEAERELEAFQKTHGRTLDQAPARRADLRLLKDNIEKREEQLPVARQRTAALIAARKPEALDPALEAQIAASQDFERRLTEELDALRRVEAEKAAPLAPVVDLEVRLAQLEQQREDAKYLVEEKRAILANTRFPDRPPSVLDALPFDSVRIEEPVTITTYQDEALRAAVVAGCCMLGVIAGLAVYLLARPRRAIIART